jgi:hypothetical protein
MAEKESAGILQKGTEEVKKGEKEEAAFLFFFSLSLSLLSKSICHQSLKPVQSNFQFTEIKEQANFNSANLKFAWLSSLTAGLTCVTQSSVDASLSRHSHCMRPQC